MKQRSLACLAISAALLLSGCSSMLDREYLDITTHNAAPTTEGDTSILRADSYQELVNVLIYMVSTGAETKSSAAARARPSPGRGPSRQFRRRLRVSHCQRPRKPHRLSCRSLCPVAAETSCSVRR